MFHKECIEPKLMNKCFYDEIMEAHHGGIAVLFYRTITLLIYCYC